MTVDEGKNWLSDLPAHWNKMRLKYVGKAIIGLTYSPDDIVGDGEGTPVLRANNLQNNKICLDSLVHVATPISEKLRIRAGDIVICSRNGSRALIGKNATALPEHEGLSFGAFTTVFRSKHSAYVGWVLNSSLFDYQAGAYLTSTINQLTTGTLNRFEIPFPSESEQKAIADFLDRETDRIDQLIEKKQRFLILAARRMDALVDGAISDPTIPRIRFENVVQRMQRPVVLSEHDELVRLGLFNRGRGIFKKPAADEEGMGDSSFCFVCKGDLILSGQFAWEGAVALATEDEEGCVVSHRYPVFRGRDGVNTAYLLGLFRSGFGDFLLNEASRGSAGRNRPLNTWRLGKEKIPIPSRELQEAVDRALAFERQLKKKTEQSISLLTEAKAALITAAVTGQIDVATWGKKGQTDRRLDEIEEAMQA